MSVDTKPVCKFDLAWRGPCGSEVDKEGEFCDKHAAAKCCSCGQQATRECSQTGIQFVCGAPLCATCEHGIPRPGESGWFNLGGGHVTKEVFDEQVRTQYRT